MAIIYTNQSSGAIRRMRNRKPTKAYLEAVKKHVKYLKKLGFDVDDTGRIKLTRNGRYAIDVVSRMIKEDDTHITGKQAAEAVPLSNKIGTGGTKPDNSWKIEASKNFTIAPAYNKGPYMVVAKQDIKTMGKKV